MDVRTWAGGSHRGSQAHTSLPVFHLLGGVTGTGPATTMWRPLHRSLLWLGPYPVTEGVHPLVTKAGLPACPSSPPQHHPLHRRESEAQTKQSQAPTPAEQPEGPSRAAWARLSPALQSPMASHCPHQGSHFPCGHYWPVTSLPSPPSARPPWALSCFLSKSHRPSPQGLCTCCSLLWNALSRISARLPPSPPSPSSPSDPGLCLSFLCSKGATQPHATHGFLSGPSTTLGG